MDWMKGVHLSEFCEKETSQEKRDKIGQTLWNFYMYQIHKLKKFHADPHPGNFLVDEDANLIAIDFGCMKEIPDSFYNPYFEVATPEALADKDYFEGKLYELEILKESDSTKEKEFFSKLFHELLSVFTQPVQAKEFDFSNPTKCASRKYTPNVIPLISNTPLFPVIPPVTKVESSLL